jgi:uncharacterized protein YijF (DUF1287 family)
MNAILRRMSDNADMRLFVLITLAATMTLRADVPEPAKKLIAAARSQIGVTTAYDPAYVKLAYPNGDVPQERGVCTDVVIRAIRAMGMDLQRLVHEDMFRAFSKYPQQWGLKSPDPNIDHRRVPNLMRFFERAGKKLAVTKDAADYRPGDLVTCLVAGNLPHIMLVSDTPSPSEPKRLQIIHNIGDGARMEDRLFEFPITGHYRYW